MNDIKTYGKQFSISKKAIINENIVGLADRMEYFKRHGHYKELPKHAKPFFCKIGLHKNTLAKDSRMGYGGITGEIYCLRCNKTLSKQTIWIETKEEGNGRPQF
jgi:hypothetical protein